MKDKIKWIELKEDECYCAYCDTIYKRCNGHRCWEGSCGF